MPKSVIGVMENIIMMKLVLEVTLGHMASMGVDLDENGSWKLFLTSIKGGRRHLKKDLAFFRKC